MSNPHLFAIRKIQLRSPTKAVLYVLSDIACEDCGLAWPGVDTIALYACLKRTSVQTALGELRRAELVEVREYARGGRGRATEYVVLPKLRGLLTAPCGGCREKMRNSPYRGRYDVSGTDKEPATRAVSPIPPAAEGEKGSPHGHQSSVESEASSSLRSPEVASPPSHRHTPTPLTREEARQEAARQLDALRVAASLKDTPEPKDGTPEAP